MYSASVFQVAHHKDVDVVEASLCLLDGVHIEERLRRVLVCAVARVHYWHCGYLACVPRTAFERMAHHNEVAIVGNDADGVFQGLALRHARNVGVGKTNYPAAHPIDRALKTQARPRGRFKKQCRNYPAVKQMRFGCFLKSLGYCEYPQYLLCGKIGDGYQTSIFHTILMY